MSDSGCAMFRLFYVCFRRLYVNYRYPYFFRCENTKKSVMHNVIASAAMIAPQIPSNPNIKGSSMTAASWNTSVRRKEISAEMRPLLRAVKKEDA